MLVVASGGGDGDASGGAVLSVEGVQLLGRVPDGGPSPQAAQSYEQVGGQRARAEHSAGG